MSAIWGCIDLSGRQIEENIPQKMGKCLEKYRIDKTKTLIENNVFMACGLQYITKESHSERMPFCDNGVFYTADCIIDDRESLISELKDNGIECVDNRVPDGDLLYFAFKVWGDKFGEHIIGLFSFALYDSNANEFRLYTDHTSSRCIHYCVENNKVYFGTLTDCIIDALPSYALCDRFMVADQVINLSFSFLIEGLTPFENVYILPYGTGVVVKKIGSTVRKKLFRYWNPTKTIKQKRKFDDIKCRKKFITTHLACVKDAIRTEGGVGVFLSSGLDSTSVASVAAKFLGESDKELNSFTSIPLKEFRELNAGKKQYFIDDESEGVLRLCEKYSNIRPNFLPCEGKSPWTYLEKWNEYMEIPGKAYVNHTWIQDAMDMASNQGCKVILGGFHGNFTISHGSIEETIVNLLKKGRLFAAVKQFEMYCRKENIRKKRYLKYFFRRCFARIHYDLIFDNIAIREDIKNKYATRTLWRQLLKNMGMSMQSYKQRQFTILFSMYFQMEGVYNTKDGLFNGIVVRDPTMDKRMLELCLELPFESYAWNGTDRRLVREYLKEYVPDEIRLINKHRGRQSGDVVIRMSRYLFPNGQKPSEKITDDISKYYDKDAVLAELEREITDERTDWIVKVVSCDLFLQRYKNGKG